MKEYRKFLKANFDELQDVKTDQMQGKPFPEIQKDLKDEEKLIELTKDFSDLQLNNSILDIIGNRASRRDFTNKEISLNELSFLLWSTQGVRKEYKTGQGDLITFRNVPSGGARQPFETYLVVRNVETLEAGIYRYQPLDHAIVFCHSIENKDELILGSVHEQKFTNNASVIFYWVIVPYKGEWRYHKAAHKTMLLDAGHLCQNLYLGCEALGLGTCAIAAYDQKLADKVVNVDGEDEFVVYIAPVGTL